MQHASLQHNKRGCCSLAGTRPQMQRATCNMQPTRCRIEIRHTQPGVSVQPCTTMQRTAYAISHAACYVQRTRKGRGLRASPHCMCKRRPHRATLQHTTHDARWHDCGCSASVHQFDRHEPSRQRYACAGQAEAQAGGHRWQSASKGSKSQLGNDLEGEREERDGRQKEKEEQRQGDLCTSREVDCNAQEIWWAAVNDKCHGPR